MGQSGSGFRIDSHPLIRYNARQSRAGWTYGSSRFFMDTSANPFFGRIAALRGARTLAVPQVLSRVLRSVRLALHPEQ